MNSWLLVIGCVGGRSKRVHPHNFVHHRRKNCEAEPVWYKKRMAQKAWHKKTNTSEAEPVLVTTIVQLNQCHFTKIVKLNQSGTKNEWLREAASKNKHLWSWSSGGTKKNAMAQQSELCPHNKWANDNSSEVDLVCIDHNYMCICVLCVVIPCIQSASVGIFHLSKIRHVQSNNFAYNSRNNDVIIILISYDSAI